MKKRTLKEENYFDKMETAFGVQHKHDNMTDEEKNQFGDMEETGIEKKGVTLGEPPANTDLKKVQKDAGKDAVDYYKSIIDKMAKNQKSNVEMPDNTKIEKSYDNALTKEEFEPKKYNIEDDERKMYYGSGMEGLRYDSDGTERQEEFDERVDELNGGDEEDTTYGNLKKDGENYKKYKYGEEKYDESEDEYQETPRVRTTVKENMGNKETISESIKVSKNDILSLNYYREILEPNVYNKLNDFKKGMYVVPRMYYQSQEALDEKIGKVVGHGKDSEGNDRIKMDTKFGRSTSYPQDLLILTDKDQLRANNNVYNENKKVRTMKYADVIKENIFKANGKLVSEEQVIKLANKVPNRVKIDETVFAITDGDNTYRLIWEGESKNGEPIITHHKDKELVNEDKQKMFHLMGFKSSDSISTKKTITESGDDAFRRMFNQVKKKGLNESVAFTQQEILSGDYGEFLSRSKEYNTINDFKKGMFVIPRRSIQDEKYFNQVLGRVVDVTENGRVVVDMSSPAYGKGHEFKPENLIIVKN
jgi:hypothetical protein